MKTPMLEVGSYRTLQTPVNSPHRNHSDLTSVVVAGCLASIASCLFLGWPHAIWATVLGWMMVIIAISDARRFIVPDYLSLPAIPLGLIATGSTGAPDVHGVVVPTHLLGLTLGATTLLTIRHLYALFRGRPGLGLGDVKLAAAAGAWTGIDGLVLVILIASCAALIFVLLLIGKDWLFGSANTGTITLRTALPFGAFLAPTIWLVYMMQAIS